MNRVIASPRRLGCRTTYARPAQASPINEAADFARSTGSRTPISDTAAIPNTVAATRNAPSGPNLATAMPAIAGPMTVVIE